MGKSKSLNELQAEFTQVVDAFIAKPDLNRLIDVDSAAKVIIANAYDRALVNDLYPELRKMFEQFRKDSDRLNAAARNNPDKGTNGTQERERYWSVLDNIWQRDQMVAELLDNGIQAADEFLSRALQEQIRSEARKQQGGMAR